MTAMVSGLFGGMGNLITMAEAGITLALIALLVFREFTAVVDGPGAPDRKNLSLVLQALLPAFGAIIYHRLSH